MNLTADETEPTVEEKYHQALRFLTKLVIATAKYMGKHRPEGEIADSMANASRDGHAFLYADRETLEQAVSKGHGPDCECYQNIAQALQFDEVDEQQLRANFIERRINEAAEAMASEIAEHPEKVDEILGKFTTAIEEQFGVEVDAEVLRGDDLKAHLRDMGVTLEGEDGKPKAERFSEQKDEQGNVFIIDSQGTIVA